MFLRLQSQNRGQKTFSFMFSSLLTITERMYKTWLKFSFFLLCLCCWGGPLKHLHLAEGHLHSFPVMQVMKPAWQTLTSRSLLSVGGWSEWVLKSAIYSAFSQLDLLWPGRTAAHSHGADKTLPALPSTVEMLESQTFMQLPDDISFSAGIDSLKQSPLHLPNKFNIQ